MLGRSRAAGDGPRTGSDRPGALAGGIRQVAGAGQGRGIGRVLCVAAIEQVLADVEDERGDGQDGDQGEGEDDEAWPRWALVQWLTTRVVLPVRVNVGMGT